jgi:hypothetical protein
VILQRDFSHTHLVFEPHKKRKQIRLEQIMDLSPFDIFGESKKELLRQQFRSLPCQESQQRHAKESYLLSWFDHQSQLL